MPVYIHSAANTDTSAPTLSQKGGWFVPLASVFAVSHVVPRFQEAGLLPVLAAAAISPVCVDRLQEVVMLVSGHEDVEPSFWESIRAAAFTVGTCTATLGVTVVVFEYIGVPIVAGPPEKTKAQLKNEQKAKKIYAKKVAKKEAKKATLPTKKDKN